MILAELHGKVPTILSRWEDPLTSSVFGLLKNLDREIGLAGFLELISIHEDFSTEELENARFVFWETRYSDDRGIRREPDVIIEVGSTTIFVEAKYLSPLDTKQVEDQYEIGQDLEEFHLLCVTDDLCEPQPILDLRDGRGIPEGRLIWTSWQEIGEMLREKVEEIDENEPTRRFSKDVIALLEEKGLTKFMPFSQVRLLEEDVSEMFDHSRLFMRQVYTFSRELRSRLEGSGLRTAFSRGIVERDGTGRSGEWQKWITTEIGPYFRDESWRTYRSEESYAYLYASFSLEDPGLYVGYSLRLTPQTTEALRSQVRAIQDSMETEVLFDLRSSSEDYIWYGKSHGELVQDFPSESEIIRARWVDMYSRHSLEETDLVEAAKVDLLAFRNMAEELGLVPVEARRKMKQQIATQSSS